MNIETKLQRFSEVVRKEAESTKDSRISVLEKKYNDSITEYQQKAQQRFDHMCEDVEIQAEKLKQQRIASINSEVKKNLIEQRTKYVETIFDNVKSKLEDFFKSPAYEELLAHNIETYKPMNPNLTAYIMLRDAAIKDSLAAKTGVNVELTDEDFLGGVKIEINANKVADCTFRHRYETEKSRFNKIRIV